MGRIAPSGNIAPQVRPAEPGDADEVAALLETLGYPCTGEEAAERITRVLADRRQRVLIAAADDVVCGMISLSLIYSLARGVDIARITALVVAPNCQRQGIGRLLLREVEQIARRAGASRLELTSNPRRVEAHEFYRSCGYADGSQHFVKLLGD
jgi:GNAT superfamily N-acetyltransferase